MKRCFFALFPDAASRERLAAEARQVAARLGGRPVGAASLHLTLVFVGRVSLEQCRVLEAIGDAVRAASFDVLLDQAGCFAKAAVAWRAPGAPSDGLLHLQASLARACSAAGFAIESRPFRAHLTMARDLNRSALAGGRREPVGAIGWTAREFVLVGSEPAPGGSVYTALRRWPLS